MRPSRPQDFKVPPAKPRPPKADPVLILQSAESVCDEKSSSHTSIVAPQPTTVQMGNRLEPQHMPEHFRYPQPPTVPPPLLKTSVKDSDQTVRDVAAFIQATVAATRSMSRDEAEYTTRQRFERFKHRVPEQWQEQLLTTILSRCCEDCKK